MDFPLLPHRCLAVVPMPSRCCPNVVLLSPLSRSRPDRVQLSSHCCPVVVPSLSCSYTVVIPLLSCPHPVVVLLSKTATNSFYLMTRTSIYAIEKLVLSRWRKYDRIFATFFWLNCWRSIFARFLHGFCTVFNVTSLNTDKIQHLYFTSYFQKDLSMLWTIKDRVAKVVCELISLAESNGKLVQKLIWIFEHWIQNRNKNKSRFFLLNHWNWLIQKSAARTKKHNKTFWPLHCSVLDLFQQKW